MQTKLASCNREEPLRMVSTGGGIRLYLQGGFFEIFKQAITAAIDDGSIPAQINRREDTMKKAYAVTITVKKFYTLNLYCSGSTGLLNGRDTDLFLNVHLPMLLSSIASAFDRQSLINLNRDIISLISGWKADFLADKKCTVHDVDADNCHHCDTPNSTTSSFTCQACLLSTHRRCAGKKKGDNLCSPCAHLELLSPPKNTTTTSQAYTAICPSLINTSLNASALALISEDTVASTDVDIPTATSRQPQYTPQSPTVLQTQLAPKLPDTRNSSFQTIPEIALSTTNAMKPAIKPSSATNVHDTPATDDIIIIDGKTLGASLSPQKTHPHVPSRPDDLQQKKFSKWEASCLKREKELAKKSIEIEINATYVKSLEEKIKTMSTP